jgi:acetyl-CoA decarbonylase/synthase complex subunit gamma
VEPGLYGLGQPDSQSPVLVTANYKLTFDLLRQSMVGHHCWLLVLDTKGVNVWCAAGKGSFGTDELVDRIKASRLAEVVSHRRLLVPQLGATGVAAGAVKKYSGFTVCYGPVMLTDIPEFLGNGWQASKAMRRKRFPMVERLVLVPVELMQGLRQWLPLMLLFLVVGGWLGDGAFIQAGLSSGLPPVLAMILGIYAGTVVTPLLLPWLPGRAFSCKGAVSGLLLFGLVFACWRHHFVSYSSWVILSWLLLTLAVSSWLGMAFTGASTYTSLNGVKKEMLRAMPLQFIGLLAGVGLWLFSFFN